MNNILLTINNYYHPIQLTANYNKIIFYYQLNQIFYSITNKDVTNSAITIMLSYMEFNH